MCWWLRLLLTIGRHGLVVDVPVSGPVSGPGSGYLIEFPASRAPFPPLPYLRLPRCLGGGCDGSLIFWVEGQDRNSPGLGDVIRRLSILLSRVLDLYDILNLLAKPSFQSLSLLSFKHTFIPPFHASNSFQHFSSSPACFLHSFSN